MADPLASIRDQRPGFDHGSPSGNDHGVSAMRHARERLRNIQGRAEARAAVQAQHLKSGVEAGGWFLIPVVSSGRWECSVCSVITAWAWSAQDPVWSCEGCGLRLTSPPAQPLLLPEQKPI